MSNVRDIETNLKRTSGLHSRKTVLYADIFAVSPTPYRIYSIFVKFAFSTG